MTRRAVAEEHRRWRAVWRLSCAQSSSISGLRRGLLVAEERSRVAGVHRDTRLLHRISIPDAPIIVERMPLRRASGHNNTRTDLERKS